jgi:hypothetical protein
MIDFEITKLPIIIIATPRTGSTAFADHLASKYPNLKLWKEPDNNPKELSDFLDYAKNNNNYILKILTNNIIKYQNWFREKIFNETCYIIKLKRRSLVEQVASFYIAMIRNIWAYHEKNIDKCKIGLPIEINESAIKKAIQLLKIDIEITDCLLCDGTFFYEDMSDLNSQNIMTPKPTNYIDLINKIEDILYKK